MTRQQINDLLAILDEAHSPYFKKEKITSAIAIAHERLISLNHDYSVIAFIGEISLDDKPLFEYNTDSLTDAKDMFNYWADRIRKDATLILQDNNEDDQVIRIQYPTSTTKI